MVAWRFLVGSLLVWAWLAFRRRRAPSRRRWPALLGLGTLYAGNGLAYLSALLWIPATTASLVFYTYPAAVVLLAAVFLGESLTRGRLGALGLTLGGCTLTAGIGALAGDPVGIGLVLLAVCGLSAYITLSHGVLEELPALGASAVILTAAGIVATLAALVAGDGLAMVPAVVESAPTDGPSPALLPRGMTLGGGAAAALYTGLMGLTATALPVTLFLEGLKHIGAGRAAIYSTVEPVLTVLLAALLLGERIAPLQYLGGALILAGVLWLRTERPLPERERPAGLEA